MSLPNYSVENVSGASYGFSLNSNQYWESQNKGVHNSYALCKISFTTDGTYNVFLDCINYAESNYDYGLLSNLDTTLTTSSSADTTNVKKNFKGQSMSTVQTVEYGKVASGEHFIYAKFIKDGSQSSNNDSLQFQLRAEADTPSISKPVFKYVNGAWEKQNAYQFINGAWVKISEKVVIPTGFNVSLSVESQEIQEGRTYVKLNTRPTSLSDYDYVTSNMTAGQDNTLYDNSGGIVSQPATIASVSKLYIWSTFSNADCTFNGTSKSIGAPSSINDVVELNVTQDSTLIIKQYWY